MRLRIALMLTLLALDIYLEVKAPPLATVILGVELLLIFQLINSLNMKHYRNIYDKMDSFEKKLVHKLLGILTLCLIVPLAVFLLEVSGYIYLWYKILTIGD